MVDVKKIDEFINKIQESRKDHKFDLSTEEDLSIGIMNLISIEEHFFFTTQKTGDDKYFDLLAEVREMRKELMKKMIKDYEGEVWCISKHLLSGSMRLMEVGTKLLGKGKKADAREMFEKSYNLYNLFWGLNLGVLDTKGIKKIEDKKIDKNDSSKDGVFAKLGAMVKRAVNCCIE